MVKKKREVKTRKLRPKSKSACNFKELPPPLPEKLILLGVVMDKTKELSIIVT